MLKVWQLTLILVKQDPLGGGQIEKGFLKLFWWEHMIFDLSKWFLNGQKYVVEKVSLYVHY